MQALAKKRPHHLRVFKVGVVGASSAELDVITRIFTVTKYRTRCYKPVALETSAIRDAKSVDFILMCSSNPNVINSWNQALTNDQSAKPIIYLTRTTNNRFGVYQLKSPVNPGKFIKLLDQYTIRELNFFPEFEIGHDSQEIDDKAISGLRLLRSASASHQLSQDQQQRKRVLVVDDSYAVRKQMQIEFELINAELDVAESAEAAMEAISDITYDIIFLDVVMPGMDGYSACKQIKRSHTNKDTPVIMLTSRSSSFDKIKGTLAGCDAYLIKPINHNEFEAVYKKHLIDNPGE